MRLLIIGDPHFKKSNLPIMKYVCQEILEMIDKYKPDVTISLGDTFDTYDNMNLRSNSIAENFYLQISNKCKLVILIGNHDRENNSDFMSDVHPFVGLGSNPRITVVGKTTAGKEGEFNFLYVPYVPHGKFRQALQYGGYDPYSEDEVSIGACKPDIIFCHQEFSGCVMDNNIKSEKGDKWSTKFPLIISGHIHEYQHLPGIIYPGSLLQHDYGESEDKALMIADFSKEEIAQGQINTQRIRLNSPPVRKTVYLNSSDLPNFLQIIPPDNVKQWEPGSKKMVLTRVKIKVESTESSALKNNPHYLALEKIVNKVDLDVKYTKINQAHQIFHTLSLEDKENKDVTLENLVFLMLQGDPEAQQIFTELVKSP